MTDANKISSNYVFYEVSLQIRAEIIFEFDEWLKDHVQAMLELPGFISASVNIPDKTMREYQYRSVKFRLRSQQDLDNYFELHAERLRGYAEARFARKFSATRKVYLIPKDQALDAYAEQIAKD